MRVKKAKKPEGQKKTHRRGLQLSQKAILRMMEEDRQVVSLKLAGHSYREIGRQLGVDESLVRKIYQRAFEEYRGDHTKLMGQAFTEGLARLQKLFNVWLPLALGEHVVKDGDGTTIVSEPDAEAARVVIRAQAQISRMWGHGQQYQVQHTGDGGGPILTANVNAQAEIGPEEAARLVREAFGGKVQPYTGPVLLPPAVVEKTG